MEYTDEFEGWWITLTIAEQAAIDDAVAALQQLGPSLGRPWVDTIKTSHHSNMKELRPRGGNIRVLFAFDARRTAILLVGGDKTGQWQDWYDETVPEADRLYEEHLNDIVDEGTP